MLVIGTTGRRNLCGYHTNSNTRILCTVSRVEFRMYEGTSCASVIRRQVKVIAKLEELQIMQSLNMHSLHINVPSALDFRIDK